MTGTVLGISEPIKNEKKIKLMEETNAPPATIAKALKEIYLNTAR